MKGTFPTQRHVPKKKIHKSSISQGEILGNTRKYWKIIGSTGKYWKITGKYLKSTRKVYREILENTGKYWKILENTGKCWKILGKWWESKAEDWYRGWKVHSQPKGMFPRGKITSFQFPKGQLPEGIFPRGNFPKLQFPQQQLLNGIIPSGNLNVQISMRQLLKSILAAAFCPISWSSRSLRPVPPTPILQPAVPEMA